MSKVSIIIPVYNKANYLKETLKSIDRQIVNDFEVILIDDKSTDNSMDIISDFKSSTRKQVRVIQNENNMGVAYSRNRGIEEAKADYITFLDADDLLDRNFLKVMLAKMKKYPYLDFVRGEFSCFYDSEDISKLKNTYIDRDEVVKLELEPSYIYSETYSANTRLYRKDSIKNLRFIDGPFEDHEFILNVLASSKQILSTNQTRYHYRLVKDGRYNTNIRDINNFLAYLDMWERFKNGNPYLNSDILKYLWNWYVDSCSSYFSRNVRGYLSGEDFCGFRERYYSCLNYYHKLEEQYQRFATYSIDSKEELLKQKQKLKEIAMKY